MVPDASAVYAGDPALFRENPAVDPQRTGHAAAVVRAKVLGGGSAVNEGVAMRARRTDFERWAGNGLRGGNTRTCSPITASWNPSRPGTRDQPRTPGVHTGLHTLGFTYVGYLNAPHNGGVGEPLSAEHQRRCAAKYKPGPPRRNTRVQVRGGVTVDTVMFDRQGHAMGVRTADGHCVRSAHTIPCAGAVGSALILLRSGVGPAHELRDHGLGVVADPPVGRRLREHPCA
ncbi:GMC family oxidoreductase N-terminal domain-containing protein [Streptomyces sp. NPDC087297]|uniref:GMC family oxidoreductase N-terminal domain-containing protein n=1 Tax=Streptomyces sp. NPDC087297 TaxID=3365778 RepID=UPI003813A403